MPLNKIYNNYLCLVSLLMIGKILYIPQYKFDLHRGKNFFISGTLNPLRLGTETLHPHRVNKKTQNCTTVLLSRRYGNSFFI